MRKQVLRAVRELIRNRSADDPSDTPARRDDGHRWHGADWRELFARVRTAEGHARGLSEPPLDQFFEVDEPNSRPIKRGRSAHLLQA